MCVSKEKHKVSRDTWIRAAFVQLSEKERFTVCRSVFSNHKHGVCSFISFHFYRVYKDTVRRVFHTVAMGIINQEIMGF